MKTANKKPTIGRKKAAHAKCNLYHTSDNQNVFDGGRIEINNAPVLPSLVSFLQFHLGRYREELARYTVKVWVQGGGVISQRYAVLKSICRALVETYPHLKKTIKVDPYLWFDSRRVERKLFGYRKARRGQQWKRR